MCRPGGFQAGFLLLFCKCQGLTEEYFEKEMEATEENALFMVTKFV